MPALRALEIGDAPDAWSALGFAVRDGACAIGGVTLALTGAGGGLRAWTLAGGGGPPSLDGLPTRWAAAASEPPGAPDPHPNGAVSLDHVVVLTAELDRTTGAFARAGAEVRRIREPPEAPARQAFLRLGEVIAEVVETGEDPPRFWGLVAVVADLDAAAARLGGALGAIRPAVQPGRRIATVRREAGLGVALALMTAHVRRSRSTVPG